MQDALEGEGTGDAWEPEGSSDEGQSEQGPGTVSMQRSSKMGPRHQQAVKVIQKIACLVPFTASLAGVAIAVLNADFAISLTNQNCSNDEKPGKSRKEKSGSQ